MRAMIKTNGAAGISGAALWSLFWRAVVLTPFAVAFGIIWALKWPLLILVLPAWEIYFLVEQEWFWAAIMLVSWLLFFLVTRSRWLKADRRDFPNDQENV